ALTATTSYWVRVSNACGTANSPTATVTIGCIPVSISGSLTDGGGLTFPVTVGNLTGLNVLSYDFTLTFDATALRLQNLPVDKTGTISEGMTITPNSSTPGRLTGSAFGAAPLSGSGTLLKIKFELVGSAANCVNLRWSSFQFNNGTPCDSATVSGPLCISGNIDYCVQSKPVPGVILTADSTPARTATSGGEGKYRLPETPRGGRA